MTQLQSGLWFANRFQIDRLVGAGGMGTVYRALDSYSGEFVALKLLQPASSNDHLSERFVREAHVLAELQHSGIVRHVAHGTSLDGQKYLAMEWLDGEDLETRLQRGPLPFADVLTLARAIAAPLALAHQKGIVHRDLKPANLFLVDRSIEKFKLQDFGIARRTAAWVHPTPEWANYAATVG